MVFLPVFGSWSRKFPEAYCMQAFVRFVELCERKVRETGIHILKIFG
jgi:hypothetical protein